MSDERAVVEGGGEKLDENVAVQASRCEETHLILFLPTHEIDLPRFVPNYFSVLDILDVSHLVLLAKAPSFIYPNLHKSSLAINVPHHIVFRVVVRIELNAVQYISSGS